MNHKNNHISRKEFLGKSLTVGVGFCALGMMAGCSLFFDAEMRVCQMDELKKAPFLISRFNRKKILVTYLEGELVVFSLICRHKRCTVAFKARNQQFECPCHDGVYDKYGNVVDGPPPGPLRRLKFEIRGKELWVLNEFI